MTCHSESDVANHMTRHVHKSPTCNAFDKSTSRILHSHRSSRDDTFSLRSNTVPSPLFQLLPSQSAPVFEHFLPTPVQFLVMFLDSFGFQHYLIQRFSGLKYSEII